MKLHLPNGLRKALLACLAALALPVTLPTTVATASGIAAAWVMVAQQAVAAYPNITNQAEYKEAASDANKNKADQTWNIDVGDTFYFQGSPGNAENWNSVTNANLNFQRTLTVNQGSGSKTQTFNGRLIGEAGSHLVYAWAGSTNTWQFNGDLSGFQGDIRCTNGTINVTFGENALSNTGAISQLESGTLNLTINGQSMQNSEISVNNLTVGVGSSFRAGMNVTAAGTLTLNGGLSLTLSGGTLTAETVNLRGNATVSLSAGASLDWCNFTASGTLTLRTEKLSDARIGMYGADYYGYVVFGTRWTGGKANIVLEGESISGRKLMLNDQGKIIYDPSEGYTQLTWSSSSTNNELDWTAREAWDDGKSFGDYSNPDAFIRGVGGTVNIGAEVSVVHVNVDGNGVYDFEGTGNKSALNVQGILYAGDDSTVRVGEGLTISAGNYMGAGTLSLNGGTVEITDATDTVIETLDVTEKGGTLGLIDGADVTLNTVESPAGDLRVEGNGGSVTVSFVESGTLKSLTQEGASEVNVRMLRDLTLNAGGQILGLFSFEFDEPGAVPARLKLGGDFTVGAGLSNAKMPSDPNIRHNDPNYHYRASVEVLSDAKVPVTLTIGDGHSARQSVLGNSITIGDADHTVNLVKEGTGIQTFSGESVDIWGDVAVNGNGALHFAGTSVYTAGGAHGNNKHNDVEIHGALSGDGGLWIANSTVKLSGLSNQIGELRFSNQCFSGDNMQNVLELKGDLVVGEIGYCGYDDPTRRPEESAADGTRGVIRRADDVSGGRVLYVLLNPIGKGLMTMDDFFGMYHDSQDNTIAKDLNGDGDTNDVVPETPGHDLNGDGDVEDNVDEQHVPQKVGVEYGDHGDWENMGMGKGGEGELQLQAGSEPVTDKKFKLAGSGTLVWVGGTHMIRDFVMGETEVVESTDEANPEPEIVGPTLRVTGGVLQLQRVSGGTLKTVDLDAREVGRAFLSLGEMLQEDLDDDRTLTDDEKVSGLGVKDPGTLRAYTLKATPGAVVELHLFKDDNIGGWLDVGEIIAEDGQFSIRLTGAKLESVQLFARQSDMWDGPGGLKEQLLGEGGTGYAWTDLFKIEMDSALLERWGVSDINELRFRITDEGELKIETTADYLLWTGSEEDVWSPTQTSGWEHNMNNPEGKNVRFTKDSGSSVVNIGGFKPVSPKNVDIESGRFIFQSAPGTDTGGLNMVDGIEDGNGILHVFEEAELHLNLRNTRIPLVNLEGILGLGHPGALPEGTRLQFNGGMLLYDTATATPDVSHLVDGDSSGLVRVAVDGAVKDGVTWGRNDTEIGDNRGLGIALNGKGLEKCGGFGNFTLAWLDDGAEHKAGLTVAEGSLTLDVGGTGFAKMKGNITGAGKLVVGGSSKVTLSGNNTVKEIELGGGTSTYLVGKTALGGAETVLTLAGGTLTGDNGAEAQAGTVKVDADTTVSVVTLTGAVTGSGTLSVEDGKTAGLTGDLSGYKGKLETGTSGTWKLSGSALEKEFDAAVSGSGTVQFDGGGTFGGDVMGGVTLRGNNGELTVTTQETGPVGATLAGTVALGNASKRAEWHDTALADGSTIYLSNVDLKAQPTKGTGTKLYVRTATSKTRPAKDIVVNVNELVDASNLDGITINGHGQLQGITGTYEANNTHGLELHFARENVEDGGVSGGTAGPAASLLAASGEKKALIKGGEAGFTLESKDDTGRKIWLDSDAVSEILTIMAQAKEEEQKATAILHLLEQGTLTMGGLTLDDLLGDEVQILRSLDTEFDVDEAKGNLVLKGSAADVFVAFAGKSELDNGTFLDQAKATVLSDETTDFTLNLDGAPHAGNEPDVTVHNLLGLAGSMLHLQNSNADTDANRLVVAFDNTQVDKIKDPSKYPTVEDTTVYGQHTTYNGSIDAGNGVDVTKVGCGTLTVGGTYTLADGTTTIREGALRLRGESNAMEGLTFDYTEDAQQTELGEEYRGLLLEGGTTTVRGAISDEGEVGKGDIKLNNAELILNGQSTLEGTSITSEDGTGKLTLQKAEGAAEGTPDPSLTLSGEKVKGVLSGVDVDVQAGLLKLQKGATMTGGSAKIGDAGTLDLGDSAGHELSSLEGSGVLKSAFGGKVRVGGESSFSGKLDSSEEGGKAGTLVVAAGANFTLSNVTTTATDTANGWGITVEGTGQDGKPGGNLTIDVSGKAAGEQLTLGAVSLGSGSTTTIKLNTETYNAEEKSTIVGSSLSFADDASIVLEAVGEEAWDYNRDLTLGTYDEVNGNLDELAEDGIKLKGAGFFRTGVKDVVVGKDGKVTVLFQATAGIELNGAGGKNANAGATLVNGSYENEQKKDLVLHSNTDYARVMNYFINHQDGAVNEQRPLSAFAGASVSILGPALSEDLHRQLGSIRNRTTTMANEVTQEAVGQLPLWHAWINGEGNYHKMDEDSLAPGYTLNSWGGTVGADADLTPHVTVGLAITAMYGDLDADAPDTATGDMDTSYLSAFVRATRGAWIHTFVVSGGIANVKLNRTVNFGGDSYTTHGDTDGYAFGAMYEVGYTGLVNKRGTAALQPVFNVEVRHVAIDGYAETGSDAGLDVDDIDRTVVTFGAGVRAQAAVATNAFNRTSVLESRLLLKLDVGDRSGTASNAIVGDKTRAEVESAEVGEFGVEFGLGISVPLGSDLGSVFLDGSVEYREGWTSANATLGYRITF